MLYIIVAILMFGLLIAVHEFGHFITAKWFHIRVNEFSIGMGPAVFKRQKGETLYSLRVLPLGGYCAMEGEDGDSDDPRSFEHAAAWKRGIVLVAGAFMNFLTGLVLLVILFAPAQGFLAEVYQGPLEGYGTEHCGLEPGDRILSVDGHQVLVYGNAQLYLGRAGDVVDFVVERDGQRVELDNVSLPYQTRVDEEGNETRDVESVELQGGRLLVTYLAEDTELSGQDRQVTCSLQAQGLTRTLEAGYTTPVFDPATLTLVSTDVSEYPTVRAYFRVTNAATGESLSGLDRQSFTVEERLSGGTYLSREVHDATLLEEKEGLNIDLVADKSDSISESDMQKVKNVMIQFVSSLQFVNGDQAEVLAFDTIVQQMCCYTDDVDLLINGINNMSTDGLTAFYDAVYDAVTYTALQGGARCVVAFTDGMDNSSIRSSQQLIQYAQAKQVPVYIIGVGGGVEEGTLRTIAQSTGGRYWYIDDLYDLESIFNSIYTEQKDLYVVEYESDPSADPFSPRSLSVSVSGGGCRGSQDVSFTPVPTAASNSGGERYVLVEEALSWQEASQRCQEMGGHLATITSQAVCNAVNSAIAAAASAG